MLMNAKKKVFVAMSGGVDSSVAAALLKEQGYDVAGVTMCFNISDPSTRRPSCCGVEGIEDARRAAQILGIPHYVLNFAKELDEDIIRNFAEEYLRGRTPNPCVRCNRYLKFGSLLKQVRDLGGHYLATGHYAQVCYNTEKGEYELLRGKDEEKEQSYFLYSIPQEVLPYILFPLGKKTKEEVREIARRYNLNTAEKPGSQDICFVPDEGYQYFLEKKLGNALKNPGPIKDKEGKIIGEHKGIAHYTIGQRDGLGIALGRPVYVYKMEAVSNTIYVGGKEQLFSRGLFASEVNFIKQNLPEQFRAVVRIRYNHPGVSAVVHQLGEDRVKIIFDEPQKAVTPGQSAVFFEDDKVLGGGIIEEALI